MQTTTNSNNIPEDNTNDKLVYSEDILDEEIEYDVTNDLKEIMSEKIQNEMNIENINSNSISTQATNIKNIYVNPNSNETNQDGTSAHPFKTIKLAVSKAAKGYDNRIYLSAGNHLLPNQIQITRTVTIIGNSKETTNITCSQNQGFKLSNNTNLTLKNLRMQNAYHTQGGAIITTNNNILKINNCIFNNNSANNGAVLFASGTGLKLDLTNSYIENNTDNKFGAIQIGGINSTNNIQKCYFKNNIIINSDISSSNGGAAIYTSNYGITTVKYCNFTNNKSNWGNAILVGNEGNLYVTYSNFTSNIADANKGSSNKNKGGAISVGSGYLEVGNSYFYNNKADIGGAISINSGQPALIYSSIFQLNHAYTQGGAINNYGTLTIKDTKFIKNNGTRRGGAILDIGNNDVLLENCNFIDNRVLTTKINGTSMVPQGGAISISGSSKYYIRNSIFNHSSAYYGGAIYSETGAAKIEITGTLFHNNTAHYGTSIIISGETSLDMNNDSFNYNRCLRKGGAIILNGSSISNINNTKFYNNSVTVNGDGEGGAIYIECYTTLYLDNCDFSKNYANLRGGVIYSASVATVTISKSNITNNIATTGSAIYIDNTKNYKSHTSSISLTTTFVSGNQGTYVFYSAKAYDASWNNNFIKLSWLGSNNPPSNLTNNFKIKSYNILKILNGSKEFSKINWKNNNINLEISRSQIPNSLTLSLKTVVEGSTTKLTDDYLQPHTFTLKENEGTEQQKTISLTYILNKNLDNILIKLDGQTINIRITA